jgi:hypothetical protein
MANTNPRLTANNIKYLTIEGGGGKGVIYLLIFDK